MYRCKLCSTSEQEIYHPAKWACPKEDKFDAGKSARYQEGRNAAKEILKRAVEGPAEATAPTQPPAAAPAGEQKGTVLEKIEFGTKIAETAKRGAEQKQAEKDWLLPAESAETFFLTVRSWFRTFSHWLDDILEAEKTEEGRIDDKIFDLNQHDLAAARGQFGQRIATKVAKALGARTVEEGIATIDSLSFLTMFGMMFLSMIGHFWKVGSQSPRLKKMRDRMAAQKKAKEDRIAAQKAKEPGTKGGPPLDVPSRPAGEPA